MAVTDVLQVTQIEATQKKKSTTANTAHNALAKALAQSYSTSLTSETSPFSPSTPTDSLHSRRWEFTGSITTGEFTVVHPMEKHEFIAINSTTGGNNIRIKTSADTGVVLKPGDHRLLYCQGSAINPVNVSLSLASALSRTEIKHFKGARVSLASAAKTLTGADKVIEWAQIDHDSNSFYSSANPSRLTIPADVSKARAMVNVYWPSDTDGKRELQILRNSTPVAHATVDALTGKMGQLALTAPVSVSVGDYFEVRVNQNAGSTLNIIVSTVTWFGIEAVEQATALQDYDLKVPYQDLAPSAGATIHTEVFSRAVQFPVGLSGSQGHGATLATGSVNFDVQLNGASKGVFIFTSTASAAVASAISAFTANAGDRVQIVAPNPADATLTGIAITLQGTKS